MGSNSHRNNFGRVQALGRENIGHVFQTPAVKDNIPAARKHLAPKQAFGEIQNVIHNQPNRTPLKNIRQGIKPSPLAVKTNKSEVSGLSAAPKSKHDHKKCGSNGPEYYWAEKSLFTWSEFEEKVNKATERKKKMKEERWKQLDDDLIKAHLPGADDLFLGCLKEEFKLNLDSDNLIPFKVPDLPVDDFAGTDFLNW